MLFLEYEDDTRACGRADFWNDTCRGCRHHNLLDLEALILGYCEVQFKCPKKKGISTEKRVKKSQTTKMHFHFTILFKKDLYHTKFVTYFLFLWIVGGGKGLEVGTLTALTKQVLTWWQKLIIIKSEGVREREEMSRCHLRGGVAL